MPLKTPPSNKPESEPIPVVAGVLAVGVHAAFIGILVMSMSWQERDHPRSSVRLWRSLPASAQSGPPAQPVPQRLTRPKPQEIRKPEIRLEPSIPALPAVQAPRALTKIEAPQTSTPTLAPATLPAPAPVPLSVSTSPPPSPASPPARVTAAPPPESPAPAPRPAPEPPPPPVPEVSSRPAPEPEVDVQAQRREKALALSERLREEGDAPANESLEREREMRRAALEKRRAERERELARKLQEVAEAAEKDRAEEQSGEAASTATASLIDDYRARIGAKIRQRVVLPPELRGNPEATYEVSLLPGGEVVEVRLRKSSGIPTYDAAVERAILAAQPLPVPDDPELFRTHFRHFLSNFRPRE
jgi:colicin import membrane protein